jgi:hypothetical protein
MKTARTEQSMRIGPRKVRQYSAAFLAGSFGLNMKDARDILARAGDDRTAAAELARVSRIVASPAARPREAGA